VKNTKYLGRPLTHKNHMHSEANSKYNSGHSSSESAVFQPPIEIALSLKILFQTPDVPHVIIMLILHIMNKNRILKNVKNKSI